MIWVNHIESHARIACDVFNSCLIQHIYKLHVFFTPECTTSPKKIVGVEPEIPVMKFPVWESPNHRCRILPWCGWQVTRMNGVETAFGEWSYQWTRMIFFGETLWLGNAIFKRIAMDCSHWLFGGWWCALHLKRLSETSLSSFSTDAWHWKGRSRSHNLNWSKTPVLKPPFTVRITGDCIVRC